MHLRCSAHNINLTMKDGMADGDENVTAVRNAIVYVRASGNMLTSFKQKVDSSRLARGSLPLSDVEFSVEVQSCV